MSPGPCEAVSTHANSSFWARAPTEVCLFSPLSGRVLCTTSMPLTPASSGLLSWSSGGEGRVCSNTGDAEEQNMLRSTMKENQSSGVFHYMYIIRFHIFLFNFSSLFCSFIYLETKIDYSNVFVSIIQRLINDHFDGIRLLNVKRNSR